jgi:hypothetical protein
VVLHLKQAPKKLLKSKRNRSQNNLLENNVKRVPAKSSTLFSGRLFWRQLRFGGNCSTLFLGRLFWGQLRFGRNHKKKKHNHTTVLAQIWWKLAPHYFLADCFGGSSDMAETTTKKMTTVLYTKYMLIKN